MESSRDRRRSSPLFDQRRSFIKKFLAKFYYVYLSFLWECIVAFSATVSTFSVSYQAAFNAGLLWQWGLVYAMDAIYIAYIVYNFVAEKRREVSHIYVRTSFIPDLVSILPLEIFSLLLGPMFNTNPVYLAGFLRLNRCIRCYKPWLLLSSKEKELDTSTMLWKSLRFIFLATLSVHIAGAIWFMASCHNVVNAPQRINETYVIESQWHGDNPTEICKPNTWGDLASTHLHWNPNSELEKYIATLYWSITTMTSVGYGDIIPTTSAERWVAIVCILWGMTMFGYIMGDLSSLLTNADAQRSKYIHRLNTIRQNLKEANVGKVLIRKVLGFYEFQWKRNKGSSVTDLLNELPAAFEAELSLETCSAMIEKSTLFKGAPAACLRMLSNAVERVLYLPDEVIVNKGDIGHYMFFLSKGEVEIQWQEVAVTLKEGDKFGEEVKEFIMDTLVLGGQFGP